MSEMHCMACDMAIKPSDSNHRGPSSPLKKHKPKNVTGPVEIRAVRRYFLKETSKDIEDVLVHYKYQVPFCKVCMDMVGKICDFEDEIIHLKQLIDSMVSCLKMKIQVSLDNGMHRHMDEQTVRLRASMIGEKSWEEKYGHIVKQDEFEEEEGQENVPEVQVELSEPKEETLEQELAEIEEVENVESESVIIETEEVPMATDEHDVHVESVVVEEQKEEEQAEGTTPEKIQSEQEPIRGERRSARIHKTGPTKYSEFLNTEEAVLSEEEDEAVEHDEDYWSEGEEYEVEYDDGQYEDMADEEIDELLELPDRSGDRPSKRLVTEFEPKKYRFEGVTFSLMEDQRYQCDECHKILKTRGGALIHIKNVHLSGPREFKTKGRPSKSGDEVPSYKRRKTERRQRPVTVVGPDQFQFQGLPFSRREDGRFQCGTCPNILKTRDSVLVHIKQRHLGEGLGTFLCHLCGKSFERDVYLKIHEINHLNPKSLHCDICGKAFTQYANLYNHKKIHTGQLNYHCEFENCGKKFLTRKQLTTHVRRHTGERPYQCELCPKKFVRGSELTIHMRSHSDVRPFECHLCDSKFFIKGRLKRHLKNVHKMETIGETTIEAVPQESIIIEVPSTTQVQVEGITQTFTVTQAAAHFLTLNDIYTSGS